MRATCGARAARCNAALASLAWLIGACGAPSGSTSGVSHAPGSPLAASTTERAEDEELDKVAAIHGAPGPWAVAGYRMGKHALAKLELGPGTFDLEIEHHTPKQVMYSCIADGAAAATGASVGKLNLALIEATPEAVATTYRRKSTGKAITLRPTAKFRARFADTPRERARDFGREVLRLPDADVFEEVASRDTSLAPFGTGPKPGPSGNASGK